MALQALVALVIHIVFPFSPARRVRPRLPGPGPSEVRPREEEHRDREQDAVPVDVANA